MNAKEARELANIATNEEHPMLKDLITYALKRIDREAKLGNNTVIDIFEKHKASFGQKKAALKLLTEEPYNFTIDTLNFNGKDFIHW